MIVKSTAFGLCLAAAGAQTCGAASLFWTFDNQADVSINLEFHSQTRSHVWPGDDQVFIIGPSDGARTYELPCNQGELICYGGWANGDGATFWGRGYNDEQTCRDCCAICGGGSAEPVELKR